MSEKISQDEAAKARIITHMNADHHDSVIRYLEHYHLLSPFSAYNGTIKDISLHNLTLLCSGTVYETPFEPPMTSYREARERLVEMDKDCVTALKRSDVTVKEFIPPWKTTASSINFPLCLATFLAFSFRSNFDAGTGLFTPLIPEGFRAFCWAIQPWLLTFLQVVHTIEALQMARSRLAKHNVNIRNPIFWLWTASTFVEGITCFKRFDGMIAKKEGEKASQKH